MGIKVDKQCTRCHRTEGIPVDSVEMALQHEKSFKGLDDGAAQIRALFEKLKSEKKMPALVVGSAEDEAIIHAHLCDPEDTKRSCTKRVLDLIESIDALEERKPRKRRAKAKPEVVETEAASEDEDVEEAVAAAG